MADFSGKDRFKYTPPYKNTFGAFQAETRSPMFICEKERLERGGQFELATRFQKEAKRKQ